MIHPTFKIKRSSESDSKHSIGIELWFFFPRFWLRVRETSPLLWFICGRLRSAGNILFAKRYTMCSVSQTKSLISESSMTSIFFNCSYSFM